MKDEIPYLKAHHKVLKYKDVPNIETVYIGHVDIETHGTRVDDFNGRFVPEFKIKELLETEQDEKCYICGDRELFQKLCAPCSEKHFDKVKEENAQYKKLCQEAFEVLSHLDGEISDPWHRNTVKTCKELFWDSHKTERRWSIYEKIKEENAQLKAEAKDHMKMTLLGADLHKCAQDNIEITVTQGKKIKGLEDAIKKGILMFKDFHYESSFNFSEVRELVELWESLTGDQENGTT